MKLLIIRHGDPDYAHDTLTEKGWREAGLLAERLARANVRDWYVSPLGRAQDTLRPTLEKTGQTATTLEWLREFPPHGIDEYTGKYHVVWDYMPRYRARYPEWNDAHGWPDCHPFRELGCRPLADQMWQGLDRVLGSYGYHREGMFYRVDRGTTDTIAFVCHFGAGTILLSHLLNISAAQLLHTTFMAPTSVTLAVTEERERGIAQFRAIQIGDTSHLYPAGEPLSLSGFFTEVYPEGGEGFY